MGWYSDLKTALDITDFGTRNIANETIKVFESYIKQLASIRKLVYQSATLARGKVKILLTSKKLSSYPQILDVLSKADKAAFDSPQRFAEYCIVVADILRKEVFDLKKERKRFSEHKEVIKGLEI